MIPFDLDKSAHVIHKIRHRYACLCSDHPNTSKHQPAHGLLHKSEGVFHQAAHLGFLTIRLLLVLGQRLILVTLFANDGAHVFRDDILVCSDIARVKPHWLAIAVTLARQLLGHSRIVHICGRCLVSTYQFGLPTDNYMVFMYEECLIALLCPTCVNVFVALLMEVVTP